MAGEHDRMPIAESVLDCSASGIEHQDIAKKDRRAAEGKAGIDVQAFEDDRDRYGDNRNNGQRIGRPCGADLLDEREYTRNVTQEATIAR